MFDLTRVAGGQIVEHWGVPDRFALLAQTGQLGRLAVNGTEARSANILA